MAGLPREVIRWLQSLDLTWQVKNAKWDLSNGYLVAEIFSWYYPQEIQMHMFYSNATSLKTKQLNWELLNSFIKRNNLEIPAEYSDATMHCKEGAATLLIEKMYEILTNRKAKNKKGYEIDFTDKAYQMKLPMHARTTATQSVKNNVKNTELDAQRSVLHSQYKAHDVIRSHVEQRRLDRLQDPERFDMKPSVAERAVRKPPPQSTAYDDPQDVQVSAARENFVGSVPGTGVKKAAPKSKSASFNKGLNGFAEVGIKQMHVSVESAS